MLIALFLSIFFTAFAFFIDWGILLSIWCMTLLLLWLFAKEWFIPGLSLFVHKFDDGPVRYIDHPEEHINYYYIRALTGILLVASFLLNLFFKNKWILLCCYDAILLFFCLYPIVRFAVKRLGFIKKLKKLCKSKGYQLRRGTGCLFANGKPHFFIEASGKKYAVRMMGSIRRVARISIVTEDTYTVQRVNPLLTEYIEQYEALTVDHTDSLFVNICIKKTLRKRIQAADGYISIFVFSSDTMWKNALTLYPLSNGEEAFGHILYDESMFLLKI